jgi:hypothetical protein
MSERETDLTYDDCITGPEGCSGKVEYRLSLSPSGVNYPRCDKHWGERLDIEEETTRKYGHWRSDLAPSWVDESYAGERWSDDY